MKICNICKISKEFTEYHEHVTTKDRLRGECKLCRNKQSKILHEKNKKISRPKKVHSNFKDITGQKFGKLTAIERVGSKQYGKRHKVTLWKCLCDCGNYKTLTRSSLIKNALSCGCIHGGYKQRKLDSQLKNLYKRHKKDCKYRNYTSDLNLEDFNKLISNNCYYCNIEPKQISRPGKSCTKEWIEKGILLYNGIDRIDNNIGYSIENCVSCCGQCNRMKNKYTKESFLLKIKLIYERHCK